MIKYLVYLVIAAVVVGLLLSGIHLYRTAEKNKEELSQYKGKEIQVEADLGRVLIVYYSLSGHTKEIAEKIQAKTGGDIFEIKTAEEIVSNPLFYYKVKKQLKNGEYFKLAGNLPDFSQYDIIFVGSPIWWYTAATPVLSFLQQADFAGKKVAPFSTQGSNPGTFVEDFTKKAKNARILKSAAFNNLPPKYNPEVENKIVVWLNNLVK